MRNVRTDMMGRQLWIIAHIVASGVFSGFALIVENAFYLAGALSILVLSISLYRIERLEAQVAELREHKTESR